MVTRWLIGRSLAIVALPHDVQRLLTLLKEKDAFAHGIEEGVGRTAAFLLEHPKLDDALVRQNLVEMESRLAAAAGAAEEKVSIARHMHELVVHHVKRLEDEVCQFEEELRLARNFGDLDDLDEGGGPAADDEPTSGGEAGGGGFLASTGPSANLEGGTSQRRGRHTERGSGERRRGGKRRSRDEVGAPGARNPRGESPRRADSSGFDQIPTNTSLGATTAVDRPAKRSRRIQDQTPADAASEAAPLNNPSSARPAAATAPLGTTTTDGSPSPAFSALEPTYCYCNQISFGEMIGCDNPACDIEWFHYGCVGLSAPPPGKWYCPDCASRLAKDYTRTLPPETLATTAAGSRGSDVPPPSLIPPAGGRRSSRTTAASADN